MGINSLLLNSAMYFILINFTHILRGMGTCHLVTENVHKVSGALKCFSRSPNRPPVLWFQLLPQICYFTKEKTHYFF